MAWAPSICLAGEEGLGWKNTWSERLIRGDFREVELWGREELLSRLTPSAFQKEMSLTIKQRLASTQEMNLPQVVQLHDKSKTSITRVKIIPKLFPMEPDFSATDLDHSSLQPCPPELVFQNYTPGEACEMALVLRNRDKAIQDFSGQLDFSVWSTAPPRRLSWFKTRRERSGQIVQLKSACSLSPKEPGSLIKQFTATSQAGKPSYWRIEPSRGVDPSKPEVSVIVIANLDDTKKFLDKMPNWAVLHQIRPSVSSLFSSAWCLTVSSTAEAKSKDKPGWLQDQLQKGKEKLAEVGQDALKLLTEDHCLPALSGTKSPDASQSPRPCSPMFKLWPLMMDLWPDQTVEMMLESCSNTAQPMILYVGEELHLCIQFNPAYENNLNSWLAERVLRVRFMAITVKGEVFFPNLQLEAGAVDLFSVIYDAAYVLYMEMTNCSLIPVQYH
ncbi:hypothetical protein HGM15179_001221 [Zosterops borbonicus]|uniref:Uncharacterized protein n=1 Tax=Zosterops borbonicus TaxID=364589 RepID=A0A8K1GUX8_9PASS|nr:hypothetical protein HGM15179_001221 [Zosterops borbonicus]